MCSCLLNGDLEYKLLIMIDLDPSLLSKSEDFHALELSGFRTSRTLPQMCHLRTTFTRIYFEIHVRCLLDEFVE